ncbi:MAG TPA: hypothetical protein VGR68_09700 [Actinomycetota bacterium]|nr:hypothetical protein [Actinomycetota bacterium]
MVDQYVPGTCNIGPAEIAVRRRVGHTGLIATVVLAAVLLAVDAAPAWRLLLALPAALAAAGYLQAWLRFCANFGFRGVYNFDALGHEQRVAAEEARAQDRRRAILVGVGSAAIGLAVALLSLLL